MIPPPLNDNKSAQVLPAPETKTILQGERESPVYLPS